MSNRHAAMSLGMTDIPDYHQNLEEFEEHGQDWVACKTCGASWSVHEPGPTYEQIDEGDGYCEQSIAEAKLKSPIGTFPHGTECHCVECI